MEEIRKIAPGYRGKPEKFDPAKVGKGSAPPKPKTEPASAAVPSPSALDKAKTPTPQKNTPLWADSIFGIDVAVRELHVNQEVTPIFARLPDVIDEVYSSLGGDDTNLGKQISKGMLMYYKYITSLGTLTGYKSQAWQHKLDLQK